ncbi:hypothetical protein CES86_4990 [Brucella lupini]|uniref:Uncharacterized protein n=1 Tax=Brucella lupini TaxID=255457 RepID=A0A256GDJ8_9HYPH|nr:hypothetical protein CES86_4990 [Brucella lupini]
MQYFGQVGFHACAFASSKYDGKAGTVCHGIVQKIEMIFALNIKASMKTYGLLPNL